MANSEYEYTRRFERPDNLLPNAWIVIRIDGHAFHKFSAKYKFEKPNDKRALRLMNLAAQAVMNEMPDVCLAYGHSDEFNFIFHPSCQLYERRESKLVSTVVSMFTAHYIFSWPNYFEDKPLSSPLPSFDGRAVVYPSLQNLKDYLNWRQADCHVNNLYNTTFWALVQNGGMSRAGAEKELSGTLSANKNEILFSRFGINYNNERELFRKGTIVFHDYYVSSPPTGKQPANKTPLQRSDTTATNVTDYNQPERTSDILDTIPTDYPPDPTEETVQLTKRPKIKSRIATAHVDIIGKDFWNRRPWVLKVGSERKRILRELFNWDSVDAVAVG